MEARPPSAPGAAGPPFLSAPHPTGSELNNNLGFGAAAALDSVPSTSASFFCGHTCGGGGRPPGRDPRGGSDGGRTWPRAGGARSRLPRVAFVGAAAPAWPAGGETGPKGPRRPGKRTSPAAVCHPGGALPLPPAPRREDGPRRCTGGRRRAQDLPERDRGRRPAGVTRARCTLHPGGAGLWPRPSRAWKSGGGHLPHVCVRARSSFFGKEAKSIMSLGLDCCRFLN